ncbi:MAG: hypothetical protein Q9162_007619 [Coniocarpon cinnabarinum]
MAKPENWESIASRTQKHRDDSILKAPGFADIEAKLRDIQLSHNVTGVAEQVLSKEDLSITRQDPETLLHNLATRKLSSVAVASAFLNRAALAQRLVNCLTELLPESALQRARELDDYIQAHGKPVGPLHGLPISVKINVGMKGRTFNCAFVSQADDVAEADATIISILQNAGAVLHARTSGPQILMHLESSSNLYGTIVNPFNTQLTAGGSSGGEGALQALRGSVLGIGGIRNPAANNGLYGLKPSVFRLPRGGGSAPFPGNEQIMSTAGPISTSLAGMQVFMKAIVDRQPWIAEPWVNPIPWREHVPDPSKRLRIAVMRDDGVVRPHPPILRALEETVEKLRQDRNIELSEWIPWRHDYAWKLILKLFFSDGAEGVRKQFDASGEPMKSLSKWILEEQASPHTKLDSRDIWQITKERDQYRAAYNQKWNDTGSGKDSLGNPVNTVDAILCPAGPGAAPPLECARYWAYTSQWNLLDYSALVFPVSKADPSRDHADPSYKPRNADDAYNHALYVPEKYQDAPLSLQLVGRRYDEEKLISITERIQKLL